MKHIFKDLKRDFNKGTILNKLIYINVGIFLFFSLIEVLSFMFQFGTSPIINKLCLPADNNRLFSQPWTFISYMFLHNGFLHLLLNMIWLHFGGRIFLQHLHPKQLLYTYILGGISGGILFVISYNYIPALKIYVTGAQALGASASVLAIIVAVATHIPNYTVQFPFIGLVKLKHIAIFIVILDLISIPKGNAGGHITHIGGAIFGYIYIIQIKKSNNFSIKIHKLKKFISNIVNKKVSKKKLHKRAKSDYEFNSERANNQKDIDKILEKIANFGYESLNNQEKGILFRASKK
jgi:membrane associated rhomboid family serine protease